MFSKIALLSVLLISVPAFSDAPKHPKVSPKQAWEACDKECLTIDGGCSAYLLTSCGKYTCEKMLCIKTSEMVELTLKWEIAKK